MAWVAGSRGLLAGDGRHQALELVREEGKGGLEANTVVGEGRLLELYVDRVAIERGGEWHAVLQSAAGIRRSPGCAGSRRRCRGCRRRGTGADVGAARGGECQRGRARSAGSPEQGAKVDIARLVVRRVGVGDVIRQHRGALAVDLQRILVNAEVGIQTYRHDGLLT